MPATAAARGETLLGRLRWTTAGIYHDSGSLASLRSTDLHVGIDKPIILPGMAGAAFLPRCCGSGQSHFQPPQRGNPFPYNRLIRDGDPLTERVVLSESAPSWANTDRRSATD